MEGRTIECGVIGSPPPTDFPCSLRFHQAAAVKGTELWLENFVIFQNRDTYALKGFVIVLRLCRRVYSYTHLQILPNHLSFLLDPLLVHDRMLRIRKEIILVVTHHFSKQFAKYFYV